MKATKQLADRKIILFEVNEVPFRVLDACCHSDSELSELMRESAQFVTTCDDTIELDPWISWPTLHRGVTDAQHQILSLGQILDGVDKRFPPIWRILTDAGRTAGVFGSIHSSHLPPSLDQYNFYVPDFFDDVAFAHPASLASFQQFNLEMTRRSARNVDTAIPRGAAARFARSALSQGFSFGTAREIVSQLMGERREPRVRVRRRSLQGLLMMDVFIHQLRRDMPDFATFYTNHVAAAMHRYWPATFPNDPNQMSTEWRDLYRAEIPEAVRICSKMLGKLRRFVDSRDDTILVVASSMGQTATNHPPSTGLYTIRNMAKFMAAFGVAPDQYRQRHAMVPCSGVVIADAVVRDAFQAKLNMLRIDTATMFESEREVGPMSYGLHEGGFFSFYVNYDMYAGEHVGYIGNQSMSFDDLGIGFIPHEDGVSVTAHHHPDGILMIYDPKRPQKGLRQRISTLEIAPALLECYGIVPPDYMIRPGAAMRVALSNRAMV